MRIFKLHHLHARLEWSGQLLYCTNHLNILNYDTVDIDVLDFIPYDLGSACYTEIEINNSNGADVEDYVPDFWDDERCDNPELTVRKGIIHTHHNMNVWFSGTDSHNLNDNAKNYSGSFYLSLIVGTDYTLPNSKKKWIAKIAWHTEPNGNGLHELKVGRKVIATSNKPCVFVCSVDVGYNFKTDTTDMTYQRVQELTPNYVHRAFKNVTLTKEYKTEFLKVFTNNTLTKGWDAHGFIAWAHTMDDKKNWFQERFYIAINHCHGADIPSCDLWEEYDITIEWLQPHVLKWIVDSIQRTDKKYSSFKKRIMSIITKV